MLTICHVNATCSGRVASGSREQTVALVRARLRAQPELEPLSHALLRRSKAANAVPYASADVSLCLETITAADQAVTDFTYQSQLCNSQLACVITQLILINLCF